MLITMSESPRAMPSSHGGSAPAEPNGGTGEFADVFARTSGDENTPEKASGHAVPPDSADGTRSDTAGDEGIAQKDDDHPEKTTAVGETLDGKPDLAPKPTAHSSAVVDEAGPFASGKKSETGLPSELADSEQRAPSSTPGAIPSVLSGHMAEEYFDSAMPGKNSATQHPPNMRLPGQGSSLGGQFVTSPAAGSVPMHTERPPPETALPIPMSNQQPEVSSTEQTAARLTQDPGAALRGADMPRGSERHALGELAPNVMQNGQENRQPVNATPLQGEGARSGLASNLTPMPQIQFMAGDDSPAFGAESPGRDGALPFLTRADGSVGQTAAHAVDFGAPRPEAVRQAAANAVEILVRQPGKPVEISLNPEELGRVRMALSTTETGIAVVISSDRSDTLDLMRKHIEQLSQEFAKLGYGDASFEFSQGDTEPAPNSDDTAAAMQPEQDEATQPETRYATRLASVGLDLRV